ncbi:hypothetical protein P3T37_001739 [Kitasatospora sp. MAA4]|nr:hypothetical protein [Kitasatospora sp. MAA4]
MAVLGQTHLINLLTGVWRVHLFSSGHFWPYSVIAALETGRTSWTAILDAQRLAHLLRDLPVEVLGRLRSDRVMRRPAPPRWHGINGRPPKHGGEFVFKNPATWGGTIATTTTVTTRYGTAEAKAWDKLHPRLTRRAAWEDYEGDLPIIAGTVIRLQVDHLPSGGDPKPLWERPLPSNELTPGSTRSPGSPRSAASTAGAVGSPTVSWLGRGLAGSRA